MEMKHGECQPNLLKQEVVKSFDKQILKYSFMCYLVN
jgi:hypothetical protein